MLATLTYFFSHRFGIVQIIFKEISKSMTRMDNIPFLYSVQIIDLPIVYDCAKSN